MAESMIERVAKAIEGVMHREDDTDPDCSTRYARAAIEAMRTPTASMEDAVAKDVDDWISEKIEDMMHLYKVAIDAALKEQEGHV
jgi:hypothetical protein